MVKLYAKFLFMHQSKNATNYVMEQSLRKNKKELESLMELRCKLGLNVTIGVAIGKGM